MLRSLASKFVWSTVEDRHILQDLHILHQRDARMEENWLSQAFRYLPQRIKLEIIKI